MGLQFFGEFLVERWAITREQLLEALDLQEYRNLKFGLLAVQKGYLNDEQVQKVSLQQRQQDRPFGDLAISMGLMSVEQVLELLTLQKNNHLFLGEAFLELGYLTEDILDRELAIFEEEQARYDPEDVPVPEVVAGRETIKACVELVHKMFNRIIGMQLKVGQATVSVQQPPRAEAGEQQLFMVGLLILAPVPIRFILSVSRSVAVAVASRVLKEDAKDERDEIVIDAVKEFCNVICGNAVARVAQQGLLVEIGPPEVLNVVPPLVENMIMVDYPIHITDGAIRLCFVAPHANTVAP